MRRALPALLVLLVLGGAPLRAQEPGDALDPAELEALRQRCPAAPQETEPAPTPAANAAQQVALEAAHQRALAMYSEGALFHAPPSGGRRLFGDPASRGARPGAKPWSLLAGMGVSLLLIAWFLLRVRPALTAQPAEEAPQETEPEPKPFSWKPQRKRKQMKPVWPAEPAAPLPDAAPKQRAAPESKGRGRQR